MVFASLHERGLLYMYAPHQHAKSTPPFRKVWLRACIYRPVARLFEQNRIVRFIFYNILFEQNSILFCSSDRRGGGGDKTQQLHNKKAIPVFHSSCPFLCSSLVNAHLLVGFRILTLPDPPPPIDDSEDDPDYTTGNEGA